MLQTEWQYVGPDFRRSGLEDINRFPADCMQASDQDDVLQLVLLALWFKQRMQEPVLPGSRSPIFGWGDARWRSTDAWLCLKKYPKAVGLLELCRLSLEGCIRAGKVKALCLVPLGRYFNVKPREPFMLRVVEGMYFAKRMALLTRRARQLVVEKGCAMVDDLLRPGTPEKLYAQVCSS